MMSTIFALLVAAGVHFLASYLWYSSVLKGGSQLSQRKALLLYLSGLIKASVLRLLIGYLQSSGIFEGMLLGFWLWLGFMVSVQLNEVLFGTKTKMEILRETIFQGFSVMLMAGLISYLT